MLRKAVLFACSYVGLGQPDGDPSLFERLPIIMKQFCPGVNVCKNNQSSSAAGRTFSPGTESCCTECSCESDCQISDDCCFPHTLSADHNTNGMLQDLQKRRSCLYSMTPQPNEDNRIYYNPFSMISSVPKSEINSSNVTSNMSCGDTSVAPWGSLLPVSSKSTNRIYKNTECAIADGITDGIVWDAEIRCEGVNPVDAVIALETNMVPENCFINFMYPDDFEDTKDFVCHGSLIETCPEDADFQLPEETDLSKKDVIALCTSGLVSPYKQMKMYANVFCHICNAEFFIQDMFCQTRSDFPERSDSLHGFTALFDKSFISEILVRKDNSHDRQPVPLACSHGDTSKCWQVFCPSGQLRIKRGKCIYPNKFWYDLTYAVNINLSLDKSYNITEIFKGPYSGISAFLPSLNSPWPKEWSVDTVLYKETKKVYHSDNVIVVMRVKLASIRPSRFIKQVKGMIKRTWSIDLYNSTVTLKSTGFGTYFLSNSLYDESIDNILFENITNNFKRPLYHVVYRSPVFSGAHQLITKMYYCEQVELDPSEFILSKDAATLYIYRSERFLYVGDFVLVWKNDFNRYDVRVCDIDSGLDIVTGSNTGARVKVCNLTFGMPGLMLVALYVKYQM